MSVWDEYTAVVQNRGGTKREHTKKTEIRLLEKRLRESLSFHNVLFDGIPQDVVILNSDNRPEKTVISMPGENIKIGSIMEWANTHWLITEKDFNTEITTKTSAKQCNYLLKWVTPDGLVHECWSIVEDGTKLRISFRVEKFA